MLDFKKRFDIATSTALISRPVDFVCRQFKCFLAWLSWLIEGCRTNPAFDHSSHRTVVPTDVDGSSHSDALPTVLSFRQLWLTDARPETEMPDASLATSLALWVLPVLRRLLPDKARSAWLPLLFPVIVSQRRCVSCAYLCILGVVATTKGGFRGARGLCPQDAKSCNIIVIVITVHRVHAQKRYVIITYNSLYYNLPYSQLNMLQQIQNCLARDVLKPPSSLTPLLFLNVYTGSK